MKGAECLVMFHLHPHLFRDLLYRKVAQLLNLIFFCSSFLFIELCLFLLRRFRRARKILLRLGVEPRLVAVGDEFAVLPYVELVLGALFALS